jgi:uncharacterized protein (DUF1501 family)
MKITRREFVKGGLTTFTVGFFAPALLTEMAHAQSALDRNLVVVYLQGGIDGLSVVIPYKDPFYFSRRPTLSLPAEQVLQIGTDASGKPLGIHPRLTGLKSIFDAGKLAIIQRAGYPNSSRSHFSGTDIWSTATPDNSTRFGWLGRYLDSLPGPIDPLTAWNTTQTLPRTLVAPIYQAPSIPSLAAYNFIPTSKGNEGTLERKFAQQISSHVPVDRPHVAFVQKTMAEALDTVDRVQKVATYKPSVTYPNTGFGKALEMVAGSMMKNVGTKIFFVVTGGFDTHAQQQTRDGNFFKLIANLDDGIKAFYQDLANQGKLNDTLILEFSEFGRRINENASAGTDHGAGSNMLAIGGSVRGGLFGTAPDLNPVPDNPTLESSGADVHFETDFRSVYAAVADQWLKTDSATLLGGDWRNPKLTFLG